MDVPASDKRQWARGLRPLLWWLLLVLVLFSIRTHERLSQQTSLAFLISMQGQPLGYEAAAKLDGEPFGSGQQVSIGWHRLMVTHPKAEPFGTNLFIWYGSHDLGDIALKRARGNLSVIVTPLADWLIIRGPEWSVILRNSSGTNALVPADTYEVEADFPHWREKGQAIVGASFSNPLHIAPRFGVVQLECNQPDASYQLLDASGQNVSSGLLPATVGELPVGSYTIVGTHHGNQREDSLFIKADATNTVHMDFQYGAAIFETTPSGATVTDGNGRQWGKTPLTVPELLSGDWNFTLGRYGYTPVQVMLDVAAGQTNVISTNLISFEYISSMNAARQFLAESNYNRAGIAVDQAIQASPLDQVAIALQRKITVLSTIQNTESLGIQSNYAAGIKLLQSALQLEPDNERAKQLMADYQKRVPEQLERERLARLNQPREVFNRELSKHLDTDLFEEHEIKVAKAVKDVASAIMDALRGQSPSFGVTGFAVPGTEAATMLAKQKVGNGERDCVIVVGQTTDTETQILFKVLEYKTKHSISMTGLLSFEENTGLVAIHPSRIPNMDDTLKARVTEGVQMVTARIQQALDNR